MMYHIEIPNSAATKLLSNQSWHCRGNVHPVRFNILHHKQEKDSMSNNCRALDGTQDWFHPDVLQIGLIDYTHEVATAKGLQNVVWLSVV
jgi:hypothetical protein